MSTGKGLWAVARWVISEGLLELSFRQETAQTRAGASKSRCRREWVGTSIGGNKSQAGTERAGMRGGADESQAKTRAGENNKRRRV